MSMIVGELRGQLVGIALSQQRMESLLNSHMEQEEQIMAEIFKRVGALEGDGREAKGRWKGIMAAVSASAVGGGWVGAMLHRLFDK